MDGLPTLVLALLGCYLIGAIPFGLILARRIKKIDLRAVGSGNIGATNAGRALGKRWGQVVFLLDMAKGLVPVLALGGLSLEESLAPWLQPCGGLAAILGHCFPVYLGFRGGKGVATTVGVLLALEPLAALIACGVWLVALLLWRMVSLASLLLGAAFPAAVAGFHGGAVVSGQVALFTIACAVAFLIWIRHYSNIRRILAGNEHRIGKQDQEGN